MDTAAMVLVCAIEMLGRSQHSFPPVTILPERPVLVSADAEAFFDRDRRAIHLIATAPAFVDAMAYVKRRQNCSHRPSLALIASILAHEEHHLRRGPGEAAAYAHQLTTLNILGFGPGSQPYHRVQLAMLAVAKKQKAVQRASR
jgi:hypothetical protein